MQTGDVTDRPPCRRRPIVRAPPRFAIEFVLRRQWEWAPARSPGCEVARGGIAADIRRQSADNEAVPIYVRVKMVVAAVPPDSEPSMDFCPLAPARALRGIVPLQENVPATVAVAVHRTVVARFGFLRPDKYEIVTV